MRGIEAFDFILRYLAIVNEDWETALDGFVLEQVPDVRYLEVSGARISWSEKFDPLFALDTSETNFCFAQLFKVYCSVQVTDRIRFIDGASNVATLFPNCIDWLNDECAREFFLYNLPLFISDESVSDNIELDSTVSKVSFLSFESQFRNDAEYNALKFGYVFSLSNCSPWNKDYLVLPNIVPLAKLNYPNLMEFYRLGLATMDPYHQYLEFYHLIEYSFYEALYQKLTVLRSRDPKQFFKHVRDGKNVTEQTMFEYVMEELATGFTGVLDAAGINARHPGSVALYGPLTADRRSWCGYLYKIRCGIVHTKEGEPILERCVDNESLLCNFLLPFMRDLCAYLLEKP